MDALEQKQRVIENLFLYSILISISSYGQILNAQMPYAFLNNPLYLGKALTFSIRVPYNFVKSLH